MNDKSVFEAREELERNYVSSALAACCGKFADILDLAAICPLEMLHSAIPYAIYRAMVEVARLGQPVSLDAIWAHIQASRLNPAKGKALWPKDLTAAHLGEYVQNIQGNAESPVFYANLVRAEGLKRQAENDLLGMVRECQRFGNDPAELASGINEISQRLEGGIPENHDLSGLMDRLLDMVENGGGSKPLPTPWPALNKVLKGGMAPGELVILAARPGMGKTALAGCMAVETARNGVPALFISREVAELTLAARMAAREGRIDARYFREGLDHAPHLAPKIREVATKMRKLPLRVVEKSIAPMTPSEVRRLAKTSKGLGLIVVDYLQLLNPDIKSLSREREVAEMSRSMKQLALDCNCPILLLSQLNRSSEESGREPRLSDLRESGAIEQDADVVIFLHARKHETRQVKMPVKAIVAKGRSSGTGVANLLFDKPFADFTEDTHAEAWARGEYSSSAENDL